MSQMRLLSIIVPERLRKQPVQPHRHALTRQRLELSARARGLELLGIVLPEAVPQRGNLIGVRHPRPVRRRPRHAKLLHRGRELRQAAVGGVLHLIGQVGPDAKLVELGSEVRERRIPESGYLNLVNVSRFGVQVLPKVGADTSCHRRLFEPGSDGVVEGAERPAYRGVAQRAEFGHERRPIVARGRADGGEALREGPLRERSERPRRGEVDGVGQSRTRLLRGNSRRHLDHRAEVLDEAGVDHVGYGGRDLGWLARRRRAGRGDPSARGTEVHVHVFLRGGEVLDAIEDVLQFRGF
mmetsp:Transcript_39686/g.95456  ORF Transcript_39686/g.95456 Transcript_39686/m.95456 type:complete len:297 (-) Transcript_39686:820-1710(-)